MCVLYIRSPLDAYYYVNGRSNMRQASDAGDCNVTDPLYCYSIMYTHLISALDESRMVASLIVRFYLYNNIDKGESIASGQGK